MSLLSALLGLGAGLCLVGGLWAGRGAALACLVVGAFAAMSGAWVMVGPAIALAALLRGQEERATPLSTLWAPLTLCALCCVAVAWAMAGSTSPQPPAVMASIEALRGEPWLALGAAALLALATLTDEEAPQ